jgi:hypothetical protein
MADKKPYQDENQKPFKIDPAKLGALEEKLGEGCYLYGFRSGGGLRVLRLEEPQPREKDRLVAYAEQCHFEHSLAHIVDQLAGAPESVKFLTGASSASSPLDLWLLNGYKFTLRYRERDLGCAPPGITPLGFVVRLENYTKNAGAWVFGPTLPYVFGLASALATAQLAYMNQSVFGLVGAEKQAPR